MPVPRATLPDDDDPARPARRAPSPATATGRALGLRHDDGTTTRWTYRELDAALPRIAAWRLRALDLEPGDRILTWSPSTPELPAAYYGAMAARLVLVPLDLRMSPAAVEGIVKASGARHLILGTGRDAPDPREAGLDRLPDHDRRGARAPSPRRTTRRSRRTGRRARRRGARPAEQEVFELVFTSGTTGTPKGVMLTHDNVVASIESFHRIVPPMEHRLVSLLPLSHLLEQAVGLYYALDVGADILYVRSRNPRVIFDALRDQRVTSMVVVPQVLDLFWSAIEREVEKRGRTTAFDRLRSVARHLPMRDPPAGSSGRSTASSAATSGCSSRPGRSCRRRSSRPGRTSASRSCRATAPPRPGPGQRRPSTDHGPGTVGRPPEGIEMRLAPDGEVQFRGRTVFKGYWNAPEATAAAFTDDGWYRTGDVGHLDDAGRLILSGREPRHHRAAERLQRVSRGHRERPARRRHPRRDRGRDQARADRGGRPVGERQPGRRDGRSGPRRRGDGPGRDPRPPRRGGQGRQRDPRAEPADRRLAAVARGRLPADAHAQDQARADPGLGRGRGRGARRAAAEARDRRRAAQPSVATA